MVGPVSVSSYTGKDGGIKFQLEIRADDVEFLTPAPREPERGEAYDSDL